MNTAQRERDQIAQECARIMLDEGCGDFARAKRKALQRLGLSGSAMLPSNVEIEAAMLAHRRLYADTDELEELQALREAALEVMQRLSDFEPRLVGSVLKGTAGAGARATLHVFCDPPEALLFSLIDKRIRYREAEKVLVVGGAVRKMPSVLLTCQGFEIEAVIFPHEGLRQAPPSQVDGRPMRRADMEEVAALVAGRLADILGERPPLTAG